MIPVLTAEDVKRQDAAAEARGIPVDALMRAAGTAVAHEAIRMLGGAYGRRVVVVCGKGNNGGDGLVAARLLRRRGAAVTVVFAASAPDEGPARRALDAYDGPIASRDALATTLSGCDLAVDAMLGVGLSRAPEGGVAECIAALNHGGGRVLSVDVPSGLNADTGEVPGDAVRATATVTFGGYKPGLLFSAGAELAGTTVVAAIGMPTDLSGGSAIALESEDVSRMLPPRTAASNKYSNGVAMIVCGSRAMPGAAVLASGACVRGGAGLVMLASHPAVCATAVASTLEIVTVPLNDSPEGVIDEKGAEQILDRLDRVNAIALGPGLSRHAAAADAVRTLVGRTRLPMVLDADGLNAFEGGAGALARRGALVLTPHEGEFARLFGAPVRDRMRDTSALAHRANAVVLLKGAGTVIASPDGRVAVNATGNAGLASAGTGDVLTGLIAALLARGMKPFEAAACAAWIHGAAAGARAAEVMESIPDVIRGLS